MARKTSNAERLADWLRNNGRHVWPHGDDWRTYCPYDDSDNLTFRVGEKRDPVFRCWGHEDDHTWPELHAAMLRAGWPAELLGGSANGGPQKASEPTKTDGRVANHLPDSYERLVVRWHRKLSHEQRTYLRDQRGLSDEVIDKFQLGDDGERITIPIRDQQGKLLNVRRYASSRPKMLNTDGYGTATLYPLDNWPSGDVIILTEGELDCLVARSRGVPAVCGTAGATAFPTRWAQHFQDKIVCVAFDLDGPGRSGARKVAKALAGVAKQVRIIDLALVESSNDPGTLITRHFKHHEGYDLTDYFVRDKMTKKDLKRLCSLTLPGDQSRERLPSMSIADLLAKPRTRLWHAKGLHIHPTFGLIGGELKTLKTTFVQFDALALASGRWVFQRFPVERPLRVLLLVGENDEDSCAHELERIGVWYGLSAADVGALPIKLVFETADVNSPKFQNTMEDEIAEFKPDVVILDPVYAYHGDDAEVQNLYSRAPLLRKFYAVAKAHGVSMWLVDHFNQTGKGLNLKRFAQAGGGEVADSWVLLAHRKPPDLNSGDFWLRMEIGSRKWGGWNWDLDVNLGVFNEDTFMREGDVTASLRRAVAARGDGTEETEGRKSIRKVLSGNDYRFTKNEIRDRVTVGRKAFETAWAAMLDKDMIHAETMPRNEHGRTYQRTLWKFVDPFADVFVQDGEA